MKLAELYRQLGLMSDAIQQFELVAAHSSREGNTKEALATVKKLVDLDPENIATRIKLAELYSKEAHRRGRGRGVHLACEQLRRQAARTTSSRSPSACSGTSPRITRSMASWPAALAPATIHVARCKHQACFKADPRNVDTLALLAQAFQALDQKAKTVSVLKELARILVIGNWLTRMEPVVG